MTKTLILAPKYPPETGGASVYFKQVVKLLEDTEFEVSVFAPIHPDEPLDKIDHGATIYRVFPPVGAEIYAGLFHLGRFDWLLKNIDPDLVHVHPHFPQYRWFRYILKARKIPRIYDCRDKDFSRRYVKDGSAYLSATEDIDQILIGEGVNPTNINRSSVVMPKIDPKTRALSGENTVGFVGELTRHKGIEKTVYAVGNLLSELDVTLHVAGDGPKRNWIEGLDRDTSWVEYHGELTHPESVGLIESVDVVCLPSKREGRPRVVVEAMQMGTPVVGSNAGDISEVVGEAGVLVDRTIPAIATGLKTVLETNWYTHEASNRSIGNTTSEVRRSVLKAYESVT